MGVFFFFFFCVSGCRGSMVLVALDVHSGTFTYMQCISSVTVIQMPQLSMLIFMLLTRIIHPFLFLCVTI